MKMAKVFVEISMSLDGFVAGPDITLEEPLGKGGEGLHDWVVRLASWREQHGLDGGDTGPDDELERAIWPRVGAVVMGRKMFSGGSGPWESDPNADAWWGDNPPFHVPVFVLTHHEREPVVKEGETTFNFVTGGIESALEQARAVAGDKDVLLSGGASVVQQCLRAGHVDELNIHVVPTLLGGGVSLFGELGTDAPGLKLTSVVESPHVTHLTYEVARPQ
jgi:dihydrofolate reductase